MAKITMDTSRSRSAAFMCAAGLSCAGVIAWLRHAPSFPVFFLISGAVGICGLLFPRQSGLFFSGIQLLLHWLGVFALAVFYFLVLTPWALVCRLLIGKKRESVQSYWVRRPPDRGLPEQYERQY
jgi:hypothetical protein